MASDNRKSDVERRFGADHRAAQRGLNPPHNCVSTRFDCNSHTGSFFEL